IMCDGPEGRPEIGPDLLPAPLLESSRASAVGGSVTVALGTPLKEVEDLLIRKTLEATLGDKTMTARLLGINSRTIYRKLERKE
ncbi:MAG TPA: helix-turn-helix domain-containing protein, partial [Bdellovibrionota bacterium]|nr:helix-turn-helix domain-containing protein [Bdellovibrionota bacterium]